MDNYLSYTGVLPTSFYAKELGDCDTAATNARTKHSIRHSSTPPFMPRREVLKHEISSEQLSEEPSRALKLEVLYKSKLVIPLCIQDLAFRCLEDLFRPQINSLLLSTQAKGESNMVLLFCSSRFSVCIFTYSEYKPINIFISNTSLGCFGQETSQTFANGSAQAGNRGTHCVKGRRFKNSEGKPSIQSLA